MSLRRAGLLVLVGAFVCALVPPAPARACGRIVIDVGHTARTPGAISARGRPEFDFNLDLARVLERNLRAQGLSDVIVSVRPGREDLGARAGAIAALDPAIVLSIHHDSVQKVYQEAWRYEGATRAFSDRFAGWSLLISTDNRFASDNLRLARSIADALLVRRLPFSTHHAEPIPGENRPLVDPDRGIYRYDRLAVLKYAPAPAVLIEAGIILNRAEETALAGRERQNLVGGAVAGAVRGFCGP